MKRLLVVTALIAALTVPVVANAASSAGSYNGWHWTVASAEQTLERQGIGWVNQNGRDLVTKAKCAGIGVSWEDGGVVRFARFRCLVNAVNPKGENERYYVRVAVTGKNSFSAKFLRFV